MDELTPRQSWIKKLAELGLGCLLSSYYGKKFTLFDSEGDELFIGVVESIGVNMKRSMNGSVIITPKGGGCWKIEAFLNCVENHDFRWKLSCGGEAVFTRIEFFN